MFDMVLDAGLGWPKRINSSGGILVEKDSTANTTDTQTATFDYGDLQVVWNHRTWGDMPDPDYPWAAIFYGEKGTLKASVFKYEFFERGKKQPALRGEPLFEYDKYPEDQTEKDLEKHVASAVAGTGRISSRRRPRVENRSPTSARLHLERVMHSGKSQQTGRAIVWDGQKGLVAGDEETNRLLRRPYRAPWAHPEPDKG
jgi:predicted dehydrogenase